MLTLQAREARLLKSRPCTQKHQVIHGIFTLSGSLFQGICTCRNVGLASEDYNSESDNSDFHHGLVLVHSPLLKKSFLVFAPPLTYMLKFGGFSDPTSRSYLMWQDLYLEAFGHHACLSNIVVNKLAGSCFVVIRTRWLREWNHITLPRGSTLNRTAAFDAEQWCRSTCRQGFASTICVQDPVGSRISAFRNVYRTSLRSSSFLGPRHWTSKVNISNGCWIDRMYRVYEKWDYPATRSNCSRKALQSTSVWHIVSHNDNYK